MIKKILLFIGVVLIFIALWQYEIIAYGLSQAKGQINILWKARPVKEVLSDPMTPDSIRQKLIFVQEVREFAVDALGINDSKNYTTIYDQKGKPSLWVVTAAKPFSLTPKEWDFPFLGTFPYKGFFNYDMALEELEVLKEGSWDTHIGVVSGWSTLGWFKDPILSNMLSRDKGELANLIIHELTHATLFVKDSVEFNENLASFIGNKGAELFLKTKYGEASQEYIQYLQRRSDSNDFISHILRGGAKLDSLYATFSEKHPTSYKAEKKEFMINKIISETDTISFNFPANYKSVLSMSTPNNAFFMSYIRYGAKLDVFETELKNEFNGDMKKYLEYLKEKYPSL